MQLSQRVSTPNMVMTDEAACSLLTNVLPALSLLAEFFATSSDDAAIAARTKSAQSLTYYINLHQELLKLRNHLSDGDGSLIIPASAIRGVLNVLESRLHRVSSFYSLFDHLSDHPRMLARTSGD
jgi:hypothetical protein